MPVPIRIVNALAVRLARVAGLGALAGMGLWLGRRLAHSKVPPPQGRWHEVRLDDGD